MLTAGAAHQQFASSIIDRFASTGASAKLLETNLSTARSLLHSARLARLARCTSVVQSAAVRHGSSVNRLAAPFL